MKHPVSAAILFTAGILCCPGILSAQTERWDRIYKGDANAWDEAVSIVRGPEGHLYVCGEIQHSATGQDLVVMSLTETGEERWIYEYNHSGAGTDLAWPLAIGPDGNLYTAGYSGLGGDETCDFTVVSLTREGVERWIYRYDGPGHIVDSATSLCFGPLNRLYVAGYSGGVGTSYDFTVVAMDYSGIEQWVYREDGPDHGHDRAYDVTMGPDGYLYTTGYMDTGVNEELTIVSIDSSGNHRWTYRESSPIAYNNSGYTLVFGPGNRIYCAGTTADHDFCVLCLYNDGRLDWKEVYPTPTFNQNRANEMIQGPDTHLYVAGSIEDPQTQQNDFTVVSLDNKGNDRWVYTLNGSANDWDEAISIGLDPEGNLLASGYAVQDGESADGLLVCLDTDGNEQWRYFYPGEAHMRDKLNDFACGAEGNVYLAGVTIGNGSNGDFTVINVDTDNSVASTVSCLPESGTLPFDASFTIRLSNVNRSWKRRIAARLDIRLGGGRRYSSWKRGWSNIEAGSSLDVSFMQHFPATGDVTGTNVIRITLEDVTPSPFNQPPHPPAGDTDTDVCTVIGLQP